MRIAIVSDIHGNLTALEAVIADLEKQAPDLVLQGGDLPYGGCHAAEVMDRVAELGWPGVLGNTDEVLWDTEPLVYMLESAPKLRPLLRMIQQCARATRDLIGESRLQVLRRLPLQLRYESMVLLHASPGDLWKSPLETADEEALERVYGRLQVKTVVYGHIHKPFVKHLRQFTVCNSGSVGMPYDGDPRASYLLLDGEQAEIRRVEYDVSKEADRLLKSNYPFKEWFAEIRQRGAYVPPPDDVAKSPKG